VGLSTEIGLRSLLAARAGLETVGHNLANVNTPGYSRQSLVASSAAPIRLRGLLQGTGVSIGLVRRTVDALLQARIAAQSTSVGRAEGKLSLLEGLQAAYAGPGGVPQLLQGFFGSLSALSTSPGEAALHANVVQSGRALADQVRELRAQSAGLAEDALDEMRGHVDQVNLLAQELVDLNRRIGSLEHGGSPANDQRDRRDQALVELARLVDVQVAEDERGAVRVQIGGRLLVGSDQAWELGLSVSGDGKSFQFHVGGSSQIAALAGGKLGGLAAALAGGLPDASQQLDAWARALILEVNRVHSTGVSAQGPFTRLVGSNALQDVDGDGDWHDVLLSGAGLPFEVQSGELFVNVTELASGELERHRISIDASTTSVGAFLDALNAVNALSAHVDGQGRLHLTAAAGFGFDFSSRLDEHPDEAGTFGGTRASLATYAAGPFGVASGDTLQLNGPAGPISVTFPAGAFAQNGQASAQELAAALNADAGFSAGGLVALAVPSSGANRLVIQTQAAGVAASVTVTGGSALAGLGWSAGAGAAGSAAAVDVKLSGSYAGTTSARLVFRAMEDGVVGGAASLLVRAFDESGKQVGEFDLGAGYQPGSSVEVAPGVKASFGAGALSAASGDFFQLDLVGDSDTTDALVALGLNGFLAGIDAQTIDVDARLQAAPELLAVGLSGDGADAANVLRLLQLDVQGSDELSGLTLGEGYGELVGIIALEVQSESAALDAEQFLLESLQGQREQISGVNQDEELVRMIEHEQAFAAAAQYLRVVNEISGELMNIL
jgi:flagellar hook-associated protein 1 FlgK